MTLASEPPAPRHRRRWLWIVLTIFLAVLSAVGWNFFNDYRARRELAEAGFSFEGNGAGLSVWNAVSSDWEGAHGNISLFLQAVRGSFKYDSEYRNGDGKGVVNEEDNGNEGEREPDPEGCALRNYDTLAPALRRLHAVRFHTSRLHTHALENVDALQALPALRDLCIANCPALRNVDGFKRLPGLEKLDIMVCPALQNVNGLKGLTNLKELYLEGCLALKNVDGLEGLTALNELSIWGCDALQNVDALKGLTNLQKVQFAKCPKLSRESIAALKAALLNTEIVSDWAE